MPNDRFTLLRAFRDAAFIEIIVAIGIAAGALIALTHQGIITW